MAQSILDVMTPNPFLVSVETPVAVAARMMRDADVGSLIVLEEGASNPLTRARLDCTSPNRS